MGLVGDLLERAARATPAAVEDRASGWWFRYVDNDTWWASAVLAHGAADGVVARIEAAERFYAERDAAARFQVCADCPGGLDCMLAERGYRKEFPVSLLTAISEPSTHADPAAEMTVRVDPALPPEWLTVLSATNRPGTDVRRETRYFGRVDRLQRYVTVFADGEPVGIGRAVADDGWTGIFNMATTPVVRRRGAASLVLGAIADWADACDAPRLYLQVEQSNVAAQRLYAAAGFTRLTTYHYRVRAPAGL